MRFFSCLLLLLAAWPLSAGDRQVFEEIIVRINNKIISRSDYERERERARQELMQTYSGEELEQKFQEREKELLKELIDQTLLVQRATDVGVSVEPDVINYLDRMRQDMGLESMEDLERLMASQGVNVEDYKQNLRDSLMAREIAMAYVQDQVMLDSQEVQEFYEEHKEEFRKPERVRLREILISSNNRTQEQLEERTREVLQKIRKGEKFEDVARAYSDASTAESGGDLGYLEPSKLAAQIRDAVNGLLERGVADPIRTREGYLILQKAEYVEAGIPPMEKVIDELRGRMFNEKAQPKLREFLNQLRREAYIYIKPGYVDAGAVEGPPKLVLRGKRRRRARSID